ncbi:MAG: MFS transporter [Candidatus Gracilibacteria bacterium]|nr:MFS transporter [Candidatus Gracilibacteria bacterium]
MKKQLTIILITVFLDIVGLGIVLPVLPFIVEGFGFSEFYVGVTFAIFSLGMFIGGLIFGRLSDKIGRNKALEMTIFLNVIGYILFAFSHNLYLFLFARFVGGLGASGMAVGQSYIADISDNSNRTSNMGLIGAMFGIGFLIGPVIGGFLSSKFGWNILGILSGFVAFLNLLLVIFFLPKITKSEIQAKKEDELYLKQTLKGKLQNLDKNILVLFIISFITALGFSSMQSTFALIMQDRFQIDSKGVGYLFGFIGVVAIIYQGKLIKIVRRYFIEKQMLIFGFIFLSLSFFLMSINNYYYAVFLIIFMFPIGYGTINPTTSALLSKLAPTHIGKTLGINTSMQSIGNIIGPFLSGALYIKWSGLPYVISSVLFLLSMLLVIRKINVKVKEN